MEGRQPRLTLTQLVTLGAFDRVEEEQGKNKEIIRSPGTYFLDGKKKKKATAILYVALVCLVP